MEHVPSQFKSSKNPAGVGPYFGVTKDDGLGKKLQVMWCDQQKMDIDQVLSWQCPPINKKKSIRVKDKSGKPLNI